MADRIPYSPVPSVASVVDAAPGQNIGVSGDSFGAPVGRAVERLGGAIERGADRLMDVAVLQQQRFNQVAVDEAFTQQQSEYRNLTFGNPSDPSAKGFYQMQGREALDNYKPMSDALEGARAKIYGGLQNDAQRLAFNQASRRFMTVTMGEMGRHADQQGKTWGATVQKSTVDVQLQAIADSWNNDQAFDAGVERGRAGTVRFLQDTYGPNVDAVVQQDALQKFTARAVTARIQAMAATNAGDAAKWLKDGTVPEAGTGRRVPIREAVDPHTYATLLQHVEAKGDQQTGTRAAISAYGGSGSPLGASISAAVSAVPGANGDTLLRTARLENSDAAPNAVSPTGARGRFQFIPTTARQYGLDDPEDVDKAANAAARLQVDNRKALTAALGRPASEDEVYLAHQQGAGGAAALIQNPNLPATTARALASDRNGNAVTVNGGKSGQTAAEFVSMWRDKFNAAGPPPGATNDAPDHTMDRAMAFSNLTRQYKNGELNDKQFEIAISRLQQLQALDSKIKADAAEQAFNEYIPALLKSPETFSRNSMLDDNRLTGMQKNTLDTILQRKLKGDIDKPTEVSQAKRTQLLDGIRDGTITSNAQLLQEVAHGGLSASDYNFTKQALDFSQTDNGKSLNAQTKDTYKAAETFISTSLTIGLQNPAREMDFQKYKFWADNQIEAAKREGKPLAPLFDPNSPQYLAKPETVAQFKSSMDDVMRMKFGGLASVADSQKTPPKQPMAATDEGKPLDEKDQLKADVASGKITRAEGAKIAREKGWLRPPPGTAAEPATLPRAMPVPTQ